MKPRQSKGTWDFEKQLEYITKTGAPEVYAESAVRVHDTIDIAQCIARSRFENPDAELVLGITRLLLDEAARFRAEKGSDL